MMKYFITLMLLFCSTIISASDLEKVYGWSQMDWVFANADAYKTFQTKKVSTLAPLAGVHIAKDNTLYISVPRWMIKDVPSTLNKIVFAKGKPVLQPYPTLWMNDLANPNGLRNVLGFTIDKKERMWILDKGDVAGEANTPDYAQKIVIYDMKEQKVLHTFIIDDNLADRKKSFLNDIAVDTDRDIAYISDSGIKNAPDNDTGIIVYNWETNKARRVLHRHPSTKNNPKVKLIANGEPVFKDNSFQVGINGIAVTDDGQYLYWSKTTGEHFYRIKTSVLKDFHTPQETIEDAVEDLGVFGGNSDGITIDKNNIVYIADLTHNRIVTYDPKTNTYDTQVQDKRLIWPDTLSISTDGWLYFSVNRLHKAFSKTLDYNAKQDNFEIWRVKLP
ncbi:MAG TPA: hypothetical protein ENJ34_03895 [Epsilonproteobacteria bacterium]|nr:hypothetical protein [Campylobacterota bacterium]